MTKMGGKTYSSSSSNSSHLQMLSLITDENELNV